MTEPLLDSYAEKRALAATKYESFAVSLPEIKRTVAELLSLIGRDGFFRQYSKHDISHIDEVIKLSEWLIDDATKRVMTDADWFLITLSIYFHDMGMLVSKKEFDDREQSGFHDFCSSVLFSGDRAAEYKARVDELPSDDRDVFLYEEFVRFNHAKRIRHWIEGTTSALLGASSEAAVEIQRILTNLDPTLRRDLALIAESHHLDDLDDLSKYKLTQPYGPTDAETANIQYCAIILRSADLLHMRRDRTPSVLFRFINPTDPVSQREWAKQNAVRRVMPRLGLNDEKIPDENAPRDTIEIHARFSDESGFFGLTSFLNYATKEIRKCHNWAETSRKQNGSKYSFAWKRIAEDNIETDGFLKETYSFDLDQNKILDLLIGHTLYNDTGVVLRELSQNGLDAIRLQQSEEQRKGSTITSGHLQVQWNTVDRILTISDNGTGMTQEIIEKHLLKVGSSRYQDQKFKDTHPSFSAISRFGIGVLSTFMVSDEVEITTCSPDESQARKISLRSVHGRYLVRLLDKEKDKEAASLMPHGTRVRLKIRPTATLGSIVNIMRQWIVVPRCRVTVTIDDEAPIEIGFKSTASALTKYLEDAGFSTDGDAPTYKVVTRNRDGIEFSYVVRWSSHFKDWSIAAVPAKAQSGPVPCTCVEGVAVVFSTPGMLNRSLTAIANAIGPGAPKTNVARSTLEATPERDELYSQIYGLYIDHVKDEIERLMKDEKYSLTWAANNAITLLPFALEDSRNTDVVLPNELRNHMKTLPVYIVEKNGERINIDFNVLKNEQTFWTVDSQLVRSAQQLVKEAKSDSNVWNIVKVLGDPGQSLPDGTILYNLNISPSLRESVEMEFEPEQIIASESSRRIQMKWGPRSNSAWLRVDEFLERTLSSRRTQFQARVQEYLDRRYTNDRGQRVSIDDMWIAAPQVKFEGMNQYASLTSNYRVFLRGDVPIATFLRNLSSRADLDEDASLQFQIFSWTFLAASQSTSDQALAWATNQLRRISADLGESIVSGSELFLDALRNAPISQFSTSLWTNRQAGPTWYD